MCIEGNLIYTPLSAVSILHDYMVLTHPNQQLTGWDLHDDEYLQHYYISQAISLKKYTIINKL